MSVTFDYFNKGDRVSHLNLGPGTVEKVDSHVRVIYDNEIADKPVRGAYDRRWFELHPDLMSRII